MAAAPDPLATHIAGAIDAAPALDRPFFHLDLAGVFPDDVYAAMMAAMPTAGHYRPMHGRSRRSDLADGTHTRTKIDLFPEYVRHFAPEHRALWRRVGAALCSRPVESAFVRRLAPGLTRRFGPDASRVGLYPIPVLTRDISGYHLAPHTDTLWKGITVQLYLPPDEANIDLGTVFHAKGPDGGLVRHGRLRFAPNTGYAFAVGSDTWHSVDAVEGAARQRDSILLTYFVDAGALRVLRNRAKRIGNFLLNEGRALTGDR